MILLDGEVVVSFAVQDQIVGNLVLGQQGIGGNIFALNIYGIK